MLTFFSLFIMCRDWNLDIATDFYFEKGKSRKQSDQKSMHTQKGKSIKLNEQTWFLHLHSLRVYESRAAYHVWTNECENFLFLWLVSTTGDIRLKIHVRFFRCSHSVFDCNLKPIDEIQCALPQLFWIKQKSQRNEKNNLDLYIWTFRNVVLKLFGIVWKTYFSNSKCSCQLCGFWTYCKCGWVISKKDNRPNSILHSSSRFISRQTIHSGAYTFSQLKYSSHGGFLEK